MSFKWLENLYPRYLRPHTSTLEIQCHDQETNHLAFAASNLGLQDHIVLSDGQARVRVYVVLPDKRSAACIWQSPGYGSTGPATSFSRDVGLWQGSFVAVAAQRSIEVRCLANLNPKSGDACHSTITTPLEGCYNIAWDSCGSFIVLCTAIRRLRLYHDHGKLCTEVDSVSDTSMAVFAPGDATMLYCITPQGVKLRSLRALPECAEYCQSVDQHNPYASSAQGRAYAAEAKKPGASSFSLVDPAASCWLPISPLPCPTVQHQPSARQAASSCQFDGSIKFAACGCTEDQPCTAGCINMQNSSHAQNSNSTVRTPFAPLLSRNEQAADGSPAAQTARSLCTLDTTPESAAACKVPATAGKTFSRQKRQGSTAGKRKADLSWLQGADDTPPSSSGHQHTSYLQTDGWGGFGEGVDTADVQQQSKGTDGSSAGPQLTNGVVTWYVADNQGKKPMFDAKSGRYQYKFQGHTAAVAQVLPLSDGLHILTSSSDNTHKLWTVEGQGLCTFKPHPEAGWGFASAISACQKYVLAAHGSSVFVWDISQVLKTAGEAPEAHSYGNHMLQLQSHECVVTAVACCDSVMASADTSGKVVLRFSS